MAGLGTPPAQTDADTPSSPDQAGEQATPEEQQLLDTFLNAVGDVLYPKPGQISPKIVADLHGQFEPPELEPFQHAQPPVAGSPQDNVAMTAVLMLIIVDSKLGYQEKANGQGDNGQAAPAAPDTESPQEDQGEGPETAEIPDAAPQPGAPPTSAPPQPDTESPAEDQGEGPETAEVPEQAPQLGTPPAPAAPAPERLPPTQEGPEAPSYAAVLWTAGEQTVGMLMQLCEHMHIHTFTEEEQTGVMARAADLYNLASPTLDRKNMKGDFMDFAQAAKAGWKPGQSTAKVLPGLPGGAAMPPQPATQGA